MVDGKTVPGPTGRAAPLIGKSLAIISDARLGGCMDAQVIVERLLAITGEDTLSIDRKWNAGIRDRTHATERRGRIARTTITRTMLRDPPPPPEGTAKVRVFDDRVPGFIAERRRGGTTFYLRYTDHRGRGREVKLGVLGDVTVDQARHLAEQLRTQVNPGPGACCRPGQSPWRLFRVCTVAAKRRPRH
jgi:hypothetical protein